MVQTRVIENGKEVGSTDYAVDADDRHVPPSGNEFRLHDVHPIIMVGFVAPQPVPVNKCTGVNFRSIVEGEERIDMCNPQVAHTNFGRVMRCHIDTIVPGARYFAHSPV